MATPPKVLARDVISDVRAACVKSGRPTTDAEVRRALEPLDGGTIERVRKAARAGFDAKPLSPDALVDIVGGVAPAIAAARELGGYYAMKAERDALAQLARPAAKTTPKAAAAKKVSARKPAPGEDEDDDREERDGDDWDDDEADDDDDEDADARGWSDEPPPEAFEYDDAVADDEPETDDDEPEASDDEPEASDDEPEASDDEPEASDDESDEPAADEDVTDADDGESDEGTESAEEEAYADEDSDSGDEPTEAADEPAYDDEESTEEEAPRSVRESTEDEITDGDEYEPEVEPARPTRRIVPVAEAPARRKKVPVTDAVREEIQALTTLFAYHRDAVRVAQELGVGIGPLNDRIEELGLRRRIHRILEQTTDIDLFSPESVGAPKSHVSHAPVVRRRGEKTERPTYEEPAPAAREERGRPAAETTPVNAHGTRVYRRTPEAPAAAAPAAPAGVTVRREYVRETRRTRLSPGAAHKQKTAPPPPPAPPPAPAKRPFSELQSTIGRTVLERLLSDEKANPRVLAGKLGERFAGPLERPLAESDLRALLAHHGLAQTFQEREVANTRFLIGFHQGARAKLANALQLQPQELGPYLMKIGLDMELERTRAERSRIELGRRRVNDRIAQVLTRAPYLDDLGVLPIIDREVREQLEERLGPAPTYDAKERTRAELGLEPNAFNKLLRRYEMA